MGDTESDTDQSGRAARSRRGFTLGLAAVGLGLAVGSGVQAASSDHEGSGSGNGNGTETGGSDGSGDADATAEDDEPTPIDAPTTIETPGAYELVADIAPTTLERGYCIGVDLGEDADGSVTLDGNGHTIDLGQVEGGTCIVSNPERRGEDGAGPGWTVDVHDVTLTGGQRGLVSNLDTGGTYADTTATGNVEGARFDVDYPEVRNSVLSGNAGGAFLSGNDVSGGAEVTFDHCTFEDNDAEGIRVVQGSATVTASRLVRNGTGVYVSAPDGAADVEDSHVCGNAEYGVYADSGTDDETGVGDLAGGADARGNYWGAANGPASYGDPEEPYEDPETGLPADGDGDAIPEGLEPGVSNVRFDPFREAPIGGVGADR